MGYGSSRSLLAIYLGNPTVITSYILLERERRRTSSPNASSVGPSVVDSLFSSCTRMHSSQQYDHVTPKVPKLQLLRVRKGRSGTTFYMLSCCKASASEIPRCLLLLPVTEYFVCGSITGLRGAYTTEEDTPKVCLPPHERCANQRYRTSLSPAALASPDSAM